MANFNPYPNILSSDAANDPVAAVEVGVRKLLQDTYASGNCKINFTQFLSYIDDFDPVRGFIYKLVGGTIRYMWPSIKEGSYLISKRHHEIPFLQQVIKGQHILANSISRDAFKDDPHPQYYIDLFKSFRISTFENIDWLLYEIFKGTDNKFTKNKYFERFSSKYYTPSDANSNGYPIYQYMSFQLTDAINTNYKVTQNHLKTDIDAIRNKISKCKVESEKELNQLKKIVPFISGTWTGEDLNWLKIHGLLLKTKQTIKDIVSDPTSYCINKYAGTETTKYDDYSYRMLKDELIIIYNPDTKEYYESAVNILGSKGFRDDWTSHFDGLTTIESEIVNKEEIMIIHKDAIKIIFRGSKTQTWQAVHHDPKITNYNNTLCFMLGTVDFLPLVRVIIKQ